MTVDWIASFTIGGSIEGENKKIAAKDNF